MDCLPNDCGGEGVDARERQLLDTGESKRGRARERTGAMGNIVGAWRSSRRSPAHKSRGFSRTVKFCAPPPGYDFGGHHKGEVAL